MKAAVLEHIGGPLTVAEVGLTPLKHGQVLVKVLMSGICGSQLQEIAGYKGNAKYVPHLMGHEGAGIVEEVGEGVTTVKVGDKVVMHWRKGQGLESDFPTYIFNGKEIQSGKVNTFCEYAIVSENRLTAVPHDTPNELCALLGCSLSTALGAINAEAKLQPGESVLIVGAGGLGANLIKAAKLAGAGVVAVMDIHEHKRSQVLGFGADLYINTSVQNIAEELKSFNLSAVDVVIETSGAKAAIEASMQLLSGKGRYIQLGQPKPGETIEIRNALHLFEGEGKSIKATQGGRFEPQNEIPRYITLYKQGALVIDDLITHRVSLDEINDALNLLRAGKAMRILIDMQTPKQSIRERLAAYTRMLFLRIAEQELVKLYIDKKLFSMVHFYVGQEAVAVGVCDALKPEDKVLGNHRSHGHYLAKGGNFRAMVAELLGRHTGLARGKGGSMHMIDKSVNFVGSTPLLGSVAPIAAGVAFEQKYNKRDTITTAFFGDGASEEGVVYETYNMAALYKVPLLLVIENNLYAINSKLKDRRPEGYDLSKLLEGMTVEYRKADGNSYDDVYAKAKELVEYVRREQKPAVLEAVVYRHMAHSTPLMDEKYRDHDTLEERLRQDPVAKLKQELLQSMSEEELQTVEDTTRAKVRADIASVENDPYPPKDDLFTDMYA